MIPADLHLHTHYSHGSSPPQAMYAAGKACGLEVLGFTEHSPRPEGFDYTHEYRSHLAAHLSDYLREVTALREGSASPRVLLGMEVDWLEGEEDFARRAATAADFDYVLGSVHFIGRWGFDDVSEPWKDLSQEECEHYYRRYFAAWKAMLASKLFSVAAHPDLIKIFSVEQFHTWLATPGGEATVRGCLTALRNAGMGMEISSAGLRKPCREIYPAPPIMAWAREMGIPVTFASDAHSAHDVAFGFARLAGYARAFGFKTCSVFARGKRHEMPF